MAHLLLAVLIVSVLIIISYSAYRGGQVPGHVAGLCPGCGTYVFPEQVEQRPYSGHSVISHRFCFTVSLRKHLHLTCVNCKHQWGMPLMRGKVNATQFKVVE